MTPKFLTCDLVLSKDNRVYVLELCPALSCHHQIFPIPGLPINIEDLIGLSMAALSPEKFQMLQAPLEPDNADVSHYRRDNDRFFKYANPAEGIIPKSKVREYLNGLLIQKKTVWPALWVNFFRHTKTNDIAERFALILKKIITRLNIPLIIVDTYPAAYACERDKVLFWQLLASCESDLLVPKEIFRFSTFEQSNQLDKLSAFLSSISSDKVIIKPTNSSLTHGVLVLSREVIVSVIKFILSLYSKKPHISKIEYHDKMMQLKKIVYPSHKVVPGPVDDIVTMQLNKFVNYCWSIDLDAVLPSNRDFFLVEAFKPPKKTEEPFAKKNIAVTSRARLQINMGSDQVVPLQIEGNRAYDLDELPPDCSHIRDIPLTVGNIYTREWHEKYPNVATDYFLRNLGGYYPKVVDAFQKPKELNWIKLLTTLSFAELLLKIKTREQNNKELQEYLDSDSVLNLNLEQVEFCWFCFRMDNQLKKCSGCGKVYYCHQDCQKADWKIFHKKECKKQ